ncbi:MAG: DUF354 domain-containing protein [Verrucomicrobiota bacterium]
MSLLQTMRRLHARCILARSKDRWPISESAGVKPEGWPGWPQGKRFAVVLTHDVEGREGLRQCEDLMNLEAKLGFRSAFYFIPEGRYPLPKELQETLKRNGFEIGVHDLRHDGKLFWSRNGFVKKARRINQYLSEWKASGFRAGFMLRRLDWMNSLNVGYDASTFDTDPFEPQPDGVDTIFPFWIPRPGGGYVELPYTLTQDSNLFFLLGQKTAEIWERKLDWIASHGGMALVIVHPDYICFQGRAGYRKYPIKLYEGFLQKIMEKYRDQYWNPLPGEVANFVRKHKELLPLRPTPHNVQSCRAIAAGSLKIWVDLENTPHIPFFKPICRELERRGYKVIFTARDAFQTCDMASAYGIKFTKIGRHYGKKHLHKLWGLFFRSMQLRSFALREKPVLALNHGSRAQILVCNLFRIPTAMIMDYEHTQTLPMVRPKWEIVPDVLSENGLGCRVKARILKYSGIKEDVYVPEFQPDPSIIRQLGLNGDVIVTVRPPATEAHYHNPEAEILLDRLMELVCSEKEVKAVMLPRNAAQEKEIKTKHPEWFKSSKTIIPNGVVNGLNLLWHSDLAVSGGGTMNREAAALGVPVYSIFRGTTGAVDRKLEQEGRLMMISSEEELKQKIKFVRRAKELPQIRPNRSTLQEITDHIEYIIRKESGIL